MSRCSICIQDKELCDKCWWNPQYALLSDCFKEYEPICPYGYVDCILDPAYIKLNHPKWYKKLYGDREPEKVGCCCNNGEMYDDEDK